MPSCSQCGEVKSTEQFSLDPRYSGGRLRAACKLCRSEQSKLYYRKNKVKVCEKTGAYVIKWRETFMGKCCRALNSARAQAMKHGHAPCIDSTELLASTLAKQKFKCVDCGSCKRLDMDHCHVTGKFRGWVCRSCNKLRG